MELHDLFQLQQVHSFILWGFYEPQNNKVIKNMTAQEMLTKFINMVDDELDTDYTLQLLNDAKNEVEEVRNWEVLKRTTTFTDDEWSFASVDFKYPISLYNDGYIPYSQIPIEDYRQRRDEHYIYYIDWSNSKLVIVNSGDNAQTKYLTYSVYSDDLGLTDTWGFPSRFHAIIPYKMAELYYASDAGEKSRAWDDRWAAQYERMLGRMETWDSMLKLRGRRSERGTLYNPKGINDPRV